MDLCKVNKFCDKKLNYFVILFSNIFKIYIQGLLIKPRTLLIYTNRVFLVPLLTIMKYNLVILAVSIIDIIVVDYLGLKGGRFEVNYVLWNYTYGIRYIVKIFIKAFGSLPSITLLYKSANWLEREVWDMYGIKIISHPNLRRILTDYSFKGHPLRKDFPLTGYVELNYSESSRTIKFLPIELAQLPKIYYYNNPWIFS